MRLRSWAVLSWALAGVLVACTVGSPTDLDDPGSGVEEDSGASPSGPPDGGSPDAATPDAAGPDAAEPTPRRSWRVVMRR